MTEGKRFVCGLVAAVPEAFGEDREAAYDYTPLSAEGDDPWARTIALDDAVVWIEDVALDVDRRAQTCAVRPDGEDALRRFFGYLEQVLETSTDEHGDVWLAVELFEGIPWTEDVIEYLGPRTRALLLHAQDALRMDNCWIGRWSETPR